MNQDEVKVGQVFKDGDWRVGNPFFLVDEVHQVKPKAFAKGRRFIGIDCAKTKTGITVAVKIALERLIKPGTRGYSLVKSPAAIGSEFPQEMQAA